LIKIPGVALTNISFDGNNMVIVGVNRAGNIWYADKNITTNPNWTQLQGALTNVSYSNKQIFGVNNGDEVFYNTNYTTSNWTKLSKKFVNISFN